MEPDPLRVLALTLVPEIGPAKWHRLLGLIGHPEAVLKLPVEQLDALGFPQKAKEFILAGSALKQAEEELLRARKLGATIIDCFSPAYPRRLREIHDPPLILYVQGNEEVLGCPAVAIVGSRRCSVYGREVTQKIARELASAGLCIVSGMARGIDSNAHLGALEVGGGTIAVLGTGIDVAYPRENRTLQRRIASTGCVITEFPIGCYPAPQNFPIRNRIISGLCLGTLITEAREFSGSLITARLTLEQDREVWAVPGNITSPGSFGPNYLIKQGARPILSAMDILDELPVWILQQLRECQQRPDSVAEKPIDVRESKVLAQLEVDREQHFDRILRQTGLSVSELGAVLLSLELKGLINHLPGNQFSRRLR